MRPLTWLGLTAGVAGLVAAALHALLPASRDGARPGAEPASSAEPDAPGAGPRPAQVLLVRQRDSGRYRVAPSGRLGILRRVSGSSLKLDLRPLDVAFQAPYVLCRAATPLSVEVSAVLAPDPETLEEHWPVHQRGRDYLRGLGESGLERALRRCLSELDPSEVQRRALNVTARVAAAARAELAASGVELRSLELRALTTRPLEGPAAFPARWGEAGAMPEDHGACA